PPVIRTRTSARLVEPGPQGAQLRLEAGVGLELRRQQEPQLGGADRAADVAVLCELPDQVVEHPERGLLRAPGTEQLRRLVPGLETRAAFPRVVEQWRIGAEVPDDEVS